LEVPERIGAIQNPDNPVKVLVKDSGVGKHCRILHRVTLLLLLLLILSAYTPQQNVSPVDEIRIGHVLAQKYEKQRGLATSPQIIEIEKYLKTVGDRISVGTSRQFRFHFDPDPRFKSAFALPGGEIFVGAGILAFMDSEDQLGTVLAHEIAHVTLNQCRDRLINVLLQRHVSLDQPDKLNVNDFFPSYGHDGELAADREGARISARAGYSPKAAIRLLETFMLLAQHTPGAPQDTSNLQERIAEINATIANDQLRIAAPENPLKLP
jgi:predicted Zn-dependent protease